MSQALFERAACAATARLGRHSPADRVHPEVVKAMNELGIDLSDRTPQPLTRELAEQADIIVTMGCGDACPYIPGKRYIDWELPDPAGKPLDEVRAIRDDIQQRVEQLAADVVTGPMTGGAGLDPPKLTHRGVRQLDGRLAAYL